MAADALRKNWLASLAHERRASPHTLRAYGDDVARFIGFQAGHTGGAVSEKTLAKLTPADIRAFITSRRSEGLGPGGVQRALAAVRSFYKFLAREGVLENAAARSIRTPRVRRGLPRPLSVEDAGRAITEAGEHTVEWMGARDAALLTLLYGAGLRISEALGLKRGDIPLGETLTVIGKGAKERSVPVLPLVAAALADYAAQIPFTGPPSSPLFLSRRGLADEPARGARPDAAAARQPGPARKGHAPCPAPFLCHPHFAGRRRPAQRAGIAGPRLAVHHPDLHRHGHGGVAGDLFQGPSPRLKNQQGMIARTRGAG